MPILSPLIGFDKMEIQNLAEKIGTYEISIIPDSGCSAAPKHPETNAVLVKVQKAQEDIEMDDLLDESFKTIKKI
jgi:thiamine biosynthesis protein ThiI